MRIEINLLPKELQKKKFKLPPAMLFKWGLASLALLVAIPLIMGGFIHAKGSALLVLRKEEAQLAPLKKEVEDLQKEAAGLQDRFAPLDKFQGRKIIWSKKLNQLSDALPREIWLTRVSLEGAEQKGLLASRADGQEQTLIIEGVVAAGKQEGMLAPLGKFIENLKSDKSFFDDFVSIESKGIKEKVIATEEIKRAVLSFEIVCPLKRTQQPATSNQ